MGIEDNKRIVRQFMKSLEEGRAEFDLLADDLKWWVQGYRDLSLAEFKALVENTKKTKAPSVMTIRHVTAEENRVAVECDGKGQMADGRTFANTYHFLYILREGRIIEVREHFDTAYARDMFGSKALARDQ